MHQADKNAEFIPYEFEGLFDNVEFHKIGIDDTIGRQQDHPGKGPDNDAYQKGRYKNQQDDRDRSGL
jgi:hypothetical protein